MNTFNNTKRPHIYHLSFFKLQYERCDTTMN